TGYIERIAAALPLPLVLYNMPSLTKVWFEIETLHRLASLEQIIAIKDSSGDLDYFSRLIELKRLRPDWAVMMGPEALLGDALRQGGDGGVCGGANLLPRLFVDTYEAFRRGDGPQLESLE